MKHKNLFILNYIRIKREAIELLRSINFCDEQINIENYNVCLANSRGALL